MRKHDKYKQKVVPVVVDISLPVHKLYNISYLAHCLKQLLKDFKKDFMKIWKYSLSFHRTSLFYVEASWGTEKKFCKYCPEILWLLSQAKGNIGLKVWPSLLDRGHLHYSDLLVWTHPLRLVYRLTIAHVAVRKRHQRQDEIIIFFTRFIMESSKLFFLPVRTHFIQLYVVWNVRI